MIGGLFSIFCLIAFVILSYFSLLDFWYRTNPTVSQNNLNFGESDLSFWVSPKSVAMIYYSNADTYSASFVLNNVPKEKLEELSNDSCTDEHFQQLGLTRRENYQYACADIWETLGKVDTIGNAEKRFFSLSITTCPVWRDFKHNLYVGNGNYSIELDTCNATNYEFGNTVEVGFAAKFASFDKNSQTLLNHIINYNETNSDGDMMFSEVRIKENELRDDVGVLTSDIKYSLFASSGSSSKVIKQGFNTSTFGRLYVAFHEDTPYYTQKQRTYQKIADLAVQTTTIFGLLSTGCRIVLSLFIDYLFIKHVAKYFVKSPSEVQRTKVFSKKASLSKYTTGIQTPEQLGISLFSYLKFKLCRCCNNSTPYQDIINYASYERLYQNAMNNKIKLDMSNAYQEEMELPQLETISHQGDQNQAEGLLESNSKEQHTSP